MFMCVGLLLRVISGDWVLASIYSIVPSGVDGMFSIDMCLAVRSQ